MSRAQRVRELLSHRNGGPIMVPPAQRNWTYSHTPLLLTNSTPHQLFQSSISVPYLYLEADMMNLGPIAVGIGNVGFPSSTVFSAIPDCIANLAPGDWICWSQDDPEDMTGVLVAPDGDVLQIQMGKPADLVDASQFWVVTGYSLINNSVTGPVNNLLHITIGNTDRT